MHCVETYNVWVFFGKSVKISVREKIVRGTPEKAAP